MEHLTKKFGGEVVLGQIRKHGAIVSLAGKLLSVDELFEIGRTLSKGLRLAEGKVYTEERWQMVRDGSKASGMTNRERKQEEMARSKRYEGKIHSFFQKGGFGFITSLEARQEWDKDIYFHKSAALDEEVEKSLKEGVKISFNADQSSKDKLPKARNIDLVK